MNIDERLLEAAITPRTRAIVAVHYAGVACEMDTIMAVAERHQSGRAVPGLGLWVVEDAAQALGSTYKGRALGSIGHFGCFRFHYTKNVVCGEGGALLVNHVAVVTPASTSLVSEPVPTMTTLIQRARIIQEKETTRWNTV